MNTEKLIARGYRRTSNKYGIVSRIDREDWVMVLAKALRRSPADFYFPGGTTPAGNWADHYRRVYSKDKIELGRELGREVPSSCRDNTGFIDPKTWTEDFYSTPRGRTSWPDMFPTPKPKAGDWFEGFTVSELIMASGPTVTGRFSARRPEFSELPSGRKVRFPMPVRQHGKEHALVTADLAAIERRIYAQMVADPSMVRTGPDEFTSVNVAKSVSQAISELVEAVATKLVDAVQQGIDEEGCGASMAAMKTWKD